MSIRSGAGWVPVGCRLGAGRVPVGCRSGAGLVPVEANGVNPGYPGCQSSFPTQDDEK